MATQKENMNPHQPARVAMILWASRYGAQNGGSMDFWEKLRPVEQQTCRDLLKEILNARPENS